jgi:hypothetical protein
MTKLGYQPNILLPEGEFFRFEILSADIEDGEYGYQLGLELKTLGGKHAGHTFKDWSKISGDEDDGLFIKEGSKAEAREADITEATLRRAKDALRVKTKKDSEGPWYWYLPTEDARPAQHEQVEHLEQVRNIPNTESPYVKEDAHVVQDAHVAHMGEGEHLRSNGHNLSADEGNERVQRLIDEGWALDAAIAQVLGHEL